MTIDHRSEDPSADLRTRNRDRNRTEVANVAMQLIVERGYEHVTVDEIAAEAGISRRTFFRYFDSKEGVVLPYEEEKLEELRRALAALPPGESIFVGLRRAILAVFARDDAFQRTEAMLRMRILAENPSLHARSLEQQTAIEAAVRQVIGDHLGVDGATDVRARVIAASTLAAVRTAAELWWTTGATRDLADVIVEALDVLAAPSSELSPPRS